MFTFCDVLHKAKQKAQTNSRELSAQDGLEMGNVRAFRDSLPYFEVYFPEELLHNDAWYPFTSEL